jgi:hypothetical protein
MQTARSARGAARRRSPGLAFGALLGLAALDCSSTKNTECFPDADGSTGGPYTLSLTVSDDGFSKTVISTQNNASITFTLTNAGTSPHGFELECVNVTSEYPNLPAGCPATTCFPPESTIAPLDPGDSTTVMFLAPTTDNLIYPFRSSAPDDATVPGLNGGQWSLM